jgi:hypothetical protein
MPQGLPDGKVCDREEVLFVFSGSSCFFFFFFSSFFPSERFNFNNDQVRIFPIDVRECGDER